jgi:ABC-type glutathione transport system ATPase component
MRGPASSAEHVARVRGRERRLGPCLELVEVSTVGDAFALALGHHVPRYDGLGLEPPAGDQTGGRRDGRDGWDRLSVVIEVLNLTKRYRQRTVVDGVTFTVRPGKVTGFLGRNGAGKTTTMRMMLGLTRPDRGFA